MSCLHDTLLNQMLILLRMSPLPNGVSSGQLANGWQGAGIRLKRGGDEKRTVEAGRRLRQPAVQQGGPSRIQRCTYRLKVPGCSYVHRSQVACRMHYLLR